MSHQQPTAANHHDNIPRVITDDINANKIIYSEMQCDKAQDLAEKYYEEHSKEMREKEAEKKKSAIGSDQSQKGN